MTSISIEWTGQSAFAGALKAREAAVDSASRAALTELTAYAESKAKGNFSGSHPRGKPHVGGAQPNIVTGNLRRSIMTKGPYPVSTDILATRIWPNAIYARAVELGNPRSHSGAYPYFAPAIRATRLRMTEVLAGAWGEII